MAFSKAWEGKAPVKAKDLKQPVKKSKSNAPEPPAAVTFDPTDPYKNTDKKGAK